MNKTLLIRLLASAISLWLPLYAVAQSNAKLLAYYRFDNNSYGNAVKGQPAAKPEWTGLAQPTADRFGNPGNAFLLDGRTCIQLPDWRVTAETEFTVSVWIHPTQKHIANQLFMSIPQGITPLMPSVSFGEDSSGAYRKPNGERSTPLPHNDWMLLTLTYSKGWSRIYIDDEAEAKIIYYYPEHQQVSQRTFDWCMGNCSGGSNTLAAVVDDFRLFSRVLSSEEIQGLFSQDTIGVGAATEKMSEYDIIAPRGADSSAVANNIASQEPDLSAPSIELNTEPLRSLFVGELEIEQPGSTGATFNNKQPYNADGFLLEGYATDNEAVKTVHVNGVPVEFNQFSGYFSVPLRLSHNVPRIVVEAMDYAGNTGEKVLDFVKKQKEQDKKEFGKYHALLIGVQNYEDPRIPKLENPVRDAEKFAAALLANYTFDSSYVRVLPNPTRDDIYEAISELGQIVDSTDNVLIFYAGHGIWKKERDMGYWLPKDAKATSEARWISNNDICTQLRGLSAKHILLVTDACFSGSILSSRGITADMKTIQLLQESSSRKAMTSGTLTTVPDKSVFMGHLLDILNTNPDPYMTDDQLFNKIKTPVINQSKRVPQFGVFDIDADAGGNFIFVRKKE